MRIAAFLLVLIVVGCSDGGPKVVRVSGVVQRSGKPLPNVAITLTPIDGGRPSWALCDQSGRFTMQYTVNQDGAQVGKHRVHVEFPPLSPQEENDLAMGKKKRPPDQKVILAKYGNSAKSSLMVDVTESGDSLTINLD
jgi:hypothetical protein